MPDVAQPTPASPRTDDPLADIRRRVADKLRGRGVPEAELPARVDAAMRANPAIDFRAAGLIED